MDYRSDKYGNQLSVLGYGCMRFTKKGNAIDQEKAEKEMLYALERGVNYFDTAYVYPGSEVCLGKFLAKGYRDKVNIATKLPHYRVKKEGDIEKFFAEELERLQTDHIDYYLMHMLNDADTWERLIGLGVKDWIEEKKASGAIRNIGFSFHGGADNFIRLIDAYDWDFCQIQFNYMDENTQAGIRGLKYAHEKGIPVIIMEPLRGGRLVNGLPKKAVKIFNDANPDRSLADWGLRWIWNHPEVTVILSGMNDIAQIEDNIKVASEAKAGSLTESELHAYEEVKQELEKKIKVPCTGCGYCMPCPHGVDIPVCFKSYNARYSDSWYVGLKSYFMCTSLRGTMSNASQCVKCGKCERMCPQHIQIREKLVEVKQHMENPVYKIAVFVSKRIMKYK